MGVASLVTVLDRFLIAPHLFEPFAVNNGCRGTEVSEALLKRGHSYEVAETGAPFEVRALDLMMQICILFTQGHIFRTLT